MSFGNKAVVVVVVIMNSKSLREDSVWKEIR